LIGNGDDNEVLTSEKVKGKQAQLLWPWSLIFLNAHKLHNHNKQHQLGHGEQVILFLSVPISKAASLRYFKNLFPSSVWHKNFKGGIYQPSTLLQVIKKKWSARQQRHLGERRD